jgi:hypothetical protein
MATMEPRSSLRSGQQVRIIECPQNHPNHVGQVGTVDRNRGRVPGTRVHVGIGICQAAAVELVDEPGTKMRGQSAGVLSNHTPPEFRRNRH